MQVGDLVKGRLSLGGRLGIIVEVVSDDPIIGEKFLLVRWNEGILDTLRASLLEVVGGQR